MTPKISCSYSTLSADDLLAKVLPDYRIEEPLECVFWERGTNDTYLVRCTGARYSMRVYRLDLYPREVIEFEVEALLHLHRRGASVAYPVARRSGEYLTEVAAPEGKRFVLLTTFAEGASPDYASLGNCRVVGESVAQLHLAADGFETSRSRPRLDLQGLLEDSLTVIRRHFAHRQDDLKLVESIAEKCRVATRAVPQSSLDTGLCHGDLHGGNLHVHDGKVTHFDFEECALGFRVYDLATFKWAECSSERRADRWPAFVEGYESVRAIGDSDRALVDTFAVIRDLSNTAFGMRNTADFGSELVSEEELSDDLERLSKFANGAFGAG